MASYKQPCIHCNKLIDRDSHFCTFCSSRTPFGYNCPTCLRTIEKGQTVCSDCGRPLYILCPYCGQQTFVEDKCEVCGKSLMVTCGNRRCGEMQFFQNTKCTACGKPIKTKNKK